MIRGIAYQSNKKFDASLYALEIKSRFIDQSHADGYYKGFGEELSAGAAGNTVTVGTGAFLVQGRMNVIVEAERLTVSAAHAGKKGCVAAHINTFQPDTEEYCVLQLMFDTTIEAIESRLKKEDVYAAEADTSNRVYELPLYAFDVGEGGAVSNLEKKIKPVEDYATVKALYDQILAQYQTHNDEMQKIKDEIVVRQGTVVKAGGRAVLEFDADTKADATVLKFDATPTKNSAKFVNSGSLFNEFSAIKREIKEDVLRYRSTSLNYSEIILEAGQEAQINTEVLLNNPMLPSLCFMYAYFFVGSSILEDTCFNCGLFQLPDSGKILMFPEVLKNNTFYHMEVRAGHNVPTDYFVSVKNRVSNVAATVYFTPLRNGESINDL